MKLEDVILELKKGAAIGGAVVAGFFGSDLIAQESHTPKKLPRAVYCDEKGSFYFDKESGCKPDYFIGLGETEFVPCTGDDVILPDKGKNECYATKPKAKPNPQPVKKKKSKCEVTYSDWSECLPDRSNRGKGVQTRTGYQKEENCERVELTEPLTRECELPCKPFYQIERWGECEDRGDGKGVRKREFATLRRCPGIPDPETEQDCELPEKLEECVPDWQYGEWGECEDRGNGRGEQVQNAEDKNRCGTDKGRKIMTRGCYLELEDSRRGWGFASRFGLRSNARNDTFDSAGNQWMYKGQAINGGLAALLDLGDSFTLGVLMEANKEEFSLDNIGASGEALTLAPGLELLLRSGRLNGALMFQYLHTGRTFDYKGDRFKSAVNGMRIATDGSVNVLELGHFGVALPFRGVVNLSNNNGNGTPNKNSYASRIMSGVLGTAHYKGVNAAFGPTLQWNRQYSKYNNTAGNSLNLGGFARFSLGSISLEGEFSDTVAGKNNYRRQGGAGRVVVPVWGLYVIPEFAGVREEIGGPLSTRNTSLMFSIGLTSRRPGDENALPRDVITYER